MIKYSRKTEVAHKLNVQKLKSLPADEAAAGRHGRREGLRCFVILGLLNRLELADGFPIDLM